MSSAFSRPKLRGVAPALSRSLRDLSWPRRRTVPNNFAMHPVTQPATTKGDQPCQS